MVAAKLFERGCCRQRIRCMTPDARATYERIRKLRKDIGPIEFDVVKAVRELRGDTTQGMTSNGRRW